MKHQQLLRNQTYTQPIEANIDHDQNLVKAIAAGEQTALAELYDCHAIPMLALARRILNNQQDAEDLLHDVFVEVWHKASSYNPERASVRGWLQLRVRSRAIDRLRSLTVAREHAMADAAADSDIMLTGSEPEKALQQEHLRRALGCLTEIQRNVVELSYFQGLSGKEVAKRCNIPVGTVKSRLSAAVVRLRHELNPNQLAY